MRGFSAGRIPGPAGPADWVLAAAVTAGVAGLALQLAGAAPALRAVLTLLFLVVAPTAAVAGLLPTLDPFARLVIAAITAVIILALTAIIMLAAGVWSPTGGLLAVAAITAACLAARLPQVRRAAAARAAWWRGAAQLAARARRRGTKTPAASAPPASPRGEPGLPQSPPPRPGATADPPGRPAKGTGVTRT